MPSSFTASKMTEATTKMPMCVAPRSWAKVVQGSGEQVKTQKIKPATRGSLLQFCRGEVLSMLSNFGWLMVYGAIDHPAAEKHEGDIYLHKDDVVDGKTLYPGDIVNFYLYVDEKGLGAEMCCVEQRANAYVDEISCVFSRLSNVFASFDIDDPEAEDGIGLEYELAKLFKTMRPCSPSSDGSTSEGTTSDSEDTEHSSLGAGSDSEEDGSSIHATIVKHPPGIRPPPGLSLAAEDDGDDIAS